MRTSEQLDKLAAALLKFQTLTEPPVKNSTADTGKFKYDYADLCSLFAHCKKAMIECGLVFTSVGLTSRILHVSGQWIEGDFTVPEGLLPQQMGSAMTYGRRYNFQGLLGINAEEDDDAASTNNKPAAPAKMTVKPGGPLSGPKPMAPKQQPQEDDRVPASVTDQQGPPAEVEGNELELATVKAYSKPKTDKKNNEYRGVLLVHADNTEKWWNLYHAETIGKLQNFKGKQVYARLEMKGEYPLCHELTAVSA